MEYPHVAYLQFLFSVFRWGVSFFKGGIPFFFGVPPFSRPPAVWLLSRRGFGGGPPARPPTTHQPYATPNPCGRGFSLPSFCSSFSFPFLLSAPAVKGSQPRGRPPCACMSRGCMSREKHAYFLRAVACGGSRAVGLRAAHFHCIHL